MTIPMNAYSWFKEISKIPRASYKEQAISNFVLEFAKVRQLRAFQDEFYNIVVFKDAHPDYQDVPTVMLQAHMDMVAEKNFDSNHNFDTDPIELIEKDGVLWANKTTLGADDGVGVAYMLALLDDPELKHPALECVFTVEEEVGLIGAIKMDCSILKSEYCIGLDSGGGPVTYTTSSGGCRSDLTLIMDRDDVIKTAYKLEVRGLIGGHSGGEIDRQRANSLKLAGIYLYEMLKVAPIRIHAIQGGLKDNAIPREADLVFSFPDEKKAEIDACIEYITGELKQQYAYADPGFRINLSETEVTGFVSDRTTKAIANLLYMLPFGPVYKNVEIEGHVLASSNIGVIDENDGKLRIAVSSRAAQAFVLDTILGQIEQLAKYEGVGFKVSSRYGGWPYIRESRLRAVLLSTYFDMSGIEMELHATHGGLELGVFKEKMPQLDIVTLGPKMYDIHTPNEHLDIGSFNESYSVLVKLLENIDRRL